MLALACKKTKRASSYGWSVVTTLHHYGDMAPQR